MCLLSRFIKAQDSVVPPGNKLKVQTVELMLKVVQANTGKGKRLKIKWFKRERLKRRMGNCIKLQL